MSTLALRGIIPCVRVEITIEPGDPPSGQAWTEGPAIEFVGWLGLLAALELLVAQAGDGGGQLDTRRQPELREDVRQVGLDRPA